MSERFKAQALLLRLNREELIALQSLVAGESLRDLALRLSSDETRAAEIKNAMKGKVGAVRDADAVRIGLYAGLGDLGT